MLKKAVLAIFNHDRPEVNSGRSHNFNELALAEIGDPSLDRTQGVEKQVFQHPAKSKVAAGADQFFLISFMTRMKYLEQ